MKNKSLILLAFLVLIFLLASRLRVHAQKLPNVQKTSVYAPANVKIDGKTNEWNDKFEAQNSATSIAYTIANDEENLYLAVQAANGGVVDKILHGGIRLKIIGSSKGDEPVILTAMLINRPGKATWHKS